MRLILPLLVLFAVFSLQGCSRQQAFDLSGPISIELDNEGLFADGSGWNLKVLEDGSATLRIATFPDAIQRHFEVGQKQLDSLREVLISQRFFELGDEYGELVPGGSTQTIIVKSGSQTKEVRRRFLMNWVANGPKSNLKDPARAVRVWRHVREWFSDKHAVNLKRYDMMVLNAID